MLVSDIITRVRNIAGDIDVLQFSDATIITWINDAMRECAADNQLLQKRATSNTAVGVSTVALPTDILKLHTIRYNGQALSIVSFERAVEENLQGTEQGTPQWVWVWAGNMEMYPVPDSVSPLEVNYTRAPVDVTGAADTPEIPTAYHARLVDYCLAQVAQQDDDLNRYQMKMQEFKTGVQDLKDQPEWENNQYPFIGISDRDAGYSMEDSYLW